MFVLHIVDVFVERTQLSMFHSLRDVENTTPSRAIAGFPETGSRNLSCPCTWIEKVDVYRGVVLEEEMQSLMSHSL